MGFIYYSLTTFFQLLIALGLQTYAKIGIVVGIASLVILTPFIAISAYLQYEQQFAVSPISAWLYELQ